MIVYDYYYKMLSVKPISVKPNYRYVRIQDFTYGGNPVYREIECNPKIYKATYPLTTSDKHIYYILNANKRNHINKSGIDMDMDMDMEMDMDIETNFTKLGTYIRCATRYSSSYVNCANCDDDYKVAMFQISNDISSIKQEIHIDEREFLYVVDIPDSNKNMVYIPDGLYGGHKIFYKTY